MKALIAGGAGRAVLAAALLTSASPVALAQGAGADSPVSTRADRVYMEADEVEHRREAGVHIARGDVRLASGSRVIYADEVEYETTTGRVTARGGVRIFDAGQPAQFADEVELDDQLSEGIAYGFATLLENGGRAAAASAVRREDGSVRLNRAFYTACELCVDGGAPTWRLRANRVVRDLDDQMIYYRDVRLEIAGVPVAYAPVFAHADPGAGNKSGFLLPSVDISNRLGLVYEQPYLWAISPSQDLVVAPRVMGEANPLLTLDYRKRFYSGMVQVETSFTYEQEFDEDGFFGPEQFRGHVFADGLFEISPEWRWGFGVQAASEDLYLRRYDFSEEPDSTSSLYSFVSGRTLINQLFVAGRGDFYYADVAVLSFDRLTDGFDDDFLPFVTPYLRFNADGELPFRLGDFDVFANAVNLRRELFNDYTRATVGASWSRPTILPGGMRFELAAFGRVDAYREALDVRGGPDDINAFTRTRGAAIADLSYPFVRPGERFDVVIAPRAAVIASNGGDPEERPLFRDSTSQDLNRSSLFQPNRVPGFDLFEDGVRADSGIEFEFNDRYDRYGFQSFVGRSFRLSGGDERFSPASGAFEDESDWIVDFEVEAGPVTAGVSSRLDTEDFDVNRLEADVGFDMWRVNAYASYLDVSDEASFVEQRQLEWGYGARFTRNWSGFYDERYDIRREESRTKAAGLEYRDDCTLFRVFWERENFQIGDLGPSESVKFEFVLFTLGGVAED